MADPRKTKIAKRYCPSCESERSERYFSKVVGDDGVATLSTYCNSCNAFDKAALSAIQVSNPSYFNQLASAQLETQETSEQ